MAWLCASLNGRQQHSGHFWLPLIFGSIKYIISLFDNRRSICFFCIYLCCYAIWFCIPAQPYGWPPPLSYYLFMVKTLCMMHFRYWFFNDWFSVALLSIHSLLHSAMPAPFTVVSFFNHFPLFWHRKNCYARPLLAVRGFGKKNVTNANSSSRSLLLLFFHANISFSLVY